MKPLAAHLDAADPGHLLERGAHGRTRYALAVDQHRVHRFDLEAAFGAEHERTGAWILYTSADSVFQIAAHEEAFGLERLYQVCRAARRLK